MAKKVDLQERLNMRFLTVSYKEKQEIYGTCRESSDTGNIALDILNLPDSVLEELLELTDPMIELVDFLNKNRSVPHQWRVSFRSMVQFIIVYFQAFVKSVFGCI